MHLSVFCSSYSVYLNEVVEHDCGNQFLVLVTVSPRNVKALLAQLIQLTQLCDLASPCTSFRGLPETIHMVSLTL